jgi:hypothetical protein
VLALLKAHDPVLTKDPAGVEVTEHVKGSVSEYAPVPKVVVVPQ